MEYLVVRDGSQFGPYEREQLLEYIRQGVFVSTDYGWHEGKSEWEPLGDLLGASVKFLDNVPQTPNAFRTPPPPAPQHQQPQRYPAAAMRSRRAPVKPPLQKTKPRLGMIFLNLILVLAGAAVAYVKFGHGKAVLHQYFPSVAMFQPAPALPPIAPPVATPIPIAQSQAQSTPQPPPTLPPSQVAPPSPPPFDFASLAANRALWPKAVRLKQSVVFPAVFQGHVAGNITVQPGAIARLVGMEGGLLVLDYSGGIQKVPWQMTDLEAEAARQAATVAEGSPELAGATAPVAEATPPTRRPSFMDSIPTDGLQLWLKPDIGVTAGSENIVSAWADQSGNGHDAIQSSSSARPTVIPSALNGLPVLHFDAAAQQYLELPDFVSRWTAGEIIAVVRASSVTTSNGLWTFGTGHADWYPFRDTAEVYGNFGAKLQQCVGRPPTGIDLTQFHILDECSQNALWQCWIDGLSYYRTKTNEVSFSSEPVLGKCSDGGYFSGEIAELLIYNQPLNVGQRDLLLGTLDEKYGLKRH